jgi:hypothetical protein
MKLNSYFKKIDIKEISTCVLLIVVGYMTTQLFMRKYNGFRVGGQNSCPLGSDLSCKLGTYPQRRGGGAPSPDPCSKVNADDCNKSWWQSKSNGAENKPIGVACKYVNDKCITPGTGFKNINGCPTKSCDGSPSPTPPPPSPTPPPPSNKISCSFTGSFETGGCYKNNKMIDPTDSNYDSDCQHCQWIRRGLLWIIIASIIVVITFVGGVIGYTDVQFDVRGNALSYSTVVTGVGLGFFVSLIISGIFMYIIYNNYGSYETKKTEN